MLNAIIIPFSISVTTIATVLVFIVKFLSSNPDDDKPFETKNAFQIVAVFLNIRVPFVILPLGISLGSQVSASFTRLQAFLELDRRILRSDRSVLCRAAATYSWQNANEEHRTPFSLRMPPFDAAPGSFVAVVGPVAAGKTALLRSILGEMTSSSPSKETIAYCAEIPFIRHQTVQQNVCGDEEAEHFDAERYEDVLMRCQLLSDMEQLPQGDRTEIGERGFNLSGGQKARIAIARAVYSRCDVLLFDDVLAALDHGVSSAILQEVLKVEKRTRIVVSMDMGVAKAADLIRCRHPRTVQCAI